MLLEVSRWCQDICSQCQNVDILAENLDTFSNLPASGTAHWLIVSKIATDLYIEGDPE